jgi:asparagine synthase (glutamine-hydrolysing)
VLARHLALDSEVGERTFYRDIFRVPSRTRATISADRVALKSYWFPSTDAAPRCRSDADFIACGRELFDRAVARCLKDTPRVAVYASGGLDSSAVAATALRLGHTDVTCYVGIPPGDLDLDMPRSRYLSEQPKIEALMRHCPGLKVRFVAPRAVHASLTDCERVFRTQGMPNFSPGGRGWFGTIDDQIVADGHAVALWGTFGNVGLSWSGRAVLMELALQGRLAALRREAKALAGERRGGALRALVRQLYATTPRQLQRAIAVLRGRNPYDVSRYSLLRPSAIARLNLKQRWRQNGFDPTFNASGRVSKRRAQLMFDHMLWSREAELMRHFSLGLEPRDPFTDRELLEFCLTVPETLYCRNGVRRWFARQVLADRLPPAILDEQRRGMQEPNWFEQLTARKPAIGAEIAALEQSALASALIDVPRLKRLYLEWPADTRMAEARDSEYQSALDRAVHVAQFIRWAENLPASADQGS